MGGFLLFLFVLVLIAMYFLPTIIAVRRGRQVGPVAMVNVFFGWSLIGWVVAMSMALSDKTAGGAPVVNQTIVMQQGAAPQTSFDTSNPN
ncbi:MAG TPA: superinfection immunity protein [Actinocrinis sp.]|nr:superinfection immunity protein [Actinocrinis sp.]